MGYKSRGGWLNTACFKPDCANRDKKCNDCFKYQGEMTQYKKEKKNAK